jgi:phosphoribosyl 1,2-cyclic phosphodiesterase
MTDTLTFAERVRAKRLMLFHHDPLHSDEMLDELWADARVGWTELGGDATQIEMAMEGGELEVGRHVVQPVHA